MILPIDENYRLTSDCRGWAIQKRRKRKHRKTGVHKDDWESILWFPTLPQVVNGLAALKIRTSDTETLADALVDVEKIAATLCQALAPKFIVTLADPLLDEKNVVASLCQADAQEREAAG